MHEIGCGLSLTTWPSSVKEIAGSLVGPSFVKAVNYCISRCPLDAPAYGLACGLVINSRGPKEAYVDRDK